MTLITRLADFQYCSSVLLLFSSFYTTPRNSMSTASPLPQKADSVTQGAANEARKVESAASNTLEDLVDDNGQSQSGLRATTALRKIGERTDLVSRLD